MSASPDLAIAREFLDLLAGRPVAAFTFQTFDDDGTRNDEAFTHVLHGTLDEVAPKLVQLNEAGAGIFVTVNETDLLGRTAANVKALRALFTDKDDATAGAFAMEPNLLVGREEDPTRYHAYWFLAPGEPLSLFRPAQKALIAHYGSDRKVCDLPRVLRVPGFLHRKGAPQLVRILRNGSATRHTIEQVIRAHGAWPLPEDDAPPEPGASGTDYEFDGTEETDGRYERCRAFLTKLRPAVSGDGGHDATFRAACECARFGLSPVQSLRLLDEFWNVAKVGTTGERGHRAKWTLTELRHKIEDAYARVTGAGEFGSRLAEAACRAAGSGTSNAPAAVDTDGLTKSIADAIQSEHRYAQDAGGRVYVYRGGVYRPDGEEQVKRLVKTTLDGWKRSKSWSIRRATEVVEYIRLDAPPLWDRPPADRINLPNGLLDVKRRILLPHDPEFLSSVQLGARYDASATCPAWDRFAGEVFPADAVGLAWEIPACLMIPGLLQKRAVLLVGEGDNGKSVYLCAVIAFLGRRNVAAVTLHKLEADRFAPARLVGRLANISPDLPSEHLKGTSVFKAITGGDEMEAERKFREAFEFEPFARLVFSANHLPRSADASDAFFRRWTVVPFDRRFEPREQVPRDELDARLSAPSELSGVLNRALDALPGLLSGDYTQAESTTTALAEFRSFTDPVAVWLERYAVAAPAALVGKDALFSAYQRHASEVGHPAITKNAFGRQVRESFPGIDEKQRTLGAKVTWCWIGLGLAEARGS